MKQVVEIRAISMVLVCNWCGPVAPGAHVPGVVIRNPFARSYDTSDQSDVPTTICHTCAATVLRAVVHGGTE